MRKHHQRQILEMLKSIEEAQSAGSYADAQEGAYALCDFIDSIKGEGTQTAALLEQYCELLFKAHSGEVKEKFLRRHLVKIENSVKSELAPDKIEIAFLSYKAGMSDALESIYLAAKTDPGCDAYFIPIPYYDRRPDGSLGEMHYEGAGSYGGNIHITDWQAYDIESRRPDVIFTFNPYDGDNFVTSIHPDFYCKRLRDFTDLLVYVPYFVTAGDGGEAGHFTQFSGYAHAHRVILQTDKARDEYIRVFKEQFGDMYGKPEEKFIALGSPKFDKVINSRREDFSLLFEWRSLIGDKKVILYNSSIGAILQGNRQYLDKLRHVLETFRANSDVVLWWRPHPLLNTAYKAMLPRLLTEYEEIVADYKSEGRGIYDDTPDLHRALALTDAYYGDGSSLVSMYNVTGKPVMLGNTDIFPDEVQPSFVEMYVSEDYIYFTAVNINAFFRICKTSRMVEFMGSFPNETAYLPRPYYRLYTAPAEVGGTMYFPPFSAKEIAAVKIGDNSGELKHEHESAFCAGSAQAGGDMFMKIPLNHDLCGEDIARAFLGAHAHEHYVFFTAYMYPAIARLNTVTNEVDYFSDWVGLFENNSGNPLTPFFGVSVAAKGSIWLASCRSNAVMEFNMQTCEFTVHEVGGKYFRYNGICFDGENFWLTAYTAAEINTPIVKWNPETGMIKEFHEIYSGGDEAVLRPGVYCGGYVWFFPALSNTAYKIDIKTDALSIAEEFNLSSQTGSAVQALKYMMPAVQGDSIYVYDNRKRTLIEYNAVTKERREESLIYSQDAAAKVKELTSDLFSADTELSTVNDCSYYESRLVRLEDFINHIAKGSTGPGETAKIDRRIELARSVSGNIDGTAGQVIYDYVKKL